MGSATIILLAIIACFPSYDPPPELADINVSQGLYDPDKGPLTLHFSEPVTLKSIEVALYVGRLDEDFRLCLPGPDGKLASTCIEEAKMVLGPCLADLAKAIIDNQDPSALKFECSGGEISIDANKQSLSISSLEGLSPCETYRVVVSAGLADQAGRKRKVPIESTFQVKSNIPCAPSTFESGFFFAVFTIEAPAPGTFQYLFWVQADDATGKTRLYGAKIRPNEGIDPLSQLNFKDWHIDHDPITGSNIIATGQTAEINGEKIFVVHPFLLRVNRPKITATGVVLSGQVSQSVVAAASDDERLLIQGRLSAPNIILGEGADQANLGAGYGTASMFRLLASEEPKFEDGIPSSISGAEIQAAFAACD
jgi:hypothetical protein